MQAVESLANLVQIASRALGNVSHLFGLAGRVLNGADHLIHVAGRLKKFLGGMFQGPGHLFQGSGKLSGYGGFILRAAGQGLNLADYGLLFLMHVVNIGSSFLRRLQAIFRSRGKVAAGVCQSLIVGNKFVNGLLQIGQQVTNLDDRMVDGRKKPLDGLPGMVTFCFAKQFVESLELLLELFLQSLPDKPEGCRAKTKPG